MAATNFSPTPTICEQDTVTRPVDGDAVNCDNLYLEAAPGATPKLTLTRLYNHVAALFMPTVSDRGVLGGDETLTLGSMEYSYDEPAANRIVTLPDGEFHRQRIMVRGTMKNPATKIEFQHAGSATVPITFSISANTKRPWAVLEWSTTGTDQWHVMAYGGGASLP